jgi:hypothetical protein
MMRKIAIGLAVATIAMGGSTLTASALHGHKSGISKGSMSGTVKSHRFGPRTYGFYEEERGRRGYTGYKPDRFDGISRYERLSPRERERLGRFAREGYERLSPREHERLGRFAREGYERLSPRERERLGRFAHEGYERLSPREHERLSRFARERLSPMERERLSRFIRGERYYRHGPDYYGRR